MGLLSLSWSLIKIFLVAVVITLLPGIPPHAEYKAYTVARPKSLDEHLLGRRGLDNAKHIFEGQMTGPEAFASYSGVVYTGIHGGFVVQIDGGEVRPLVKFGEDCEDLTEEHICGRPLGMKFDSVGNLYVADAYYGIFKYNVQKGEKILLVGPNEEIDGKTCAFFNDVAVGKDGTVYFTVSSTTFPLYEGVQSILAAGDGRLVKFDPHRKKLSVLAEGLLFPNGIALSPNEDYLVFAETAGARIMRYNLKESNQGPPEVFAEGLPGLPDNVRPDGNGGFFVSLIVHADETHPALPVVLGPFPLIRKFLGRLLYLLEYPFALINKMYPNYVCRCAAHMIGHFSSISFLSPDGVTILNLNANGQITDALVGRDGSVNHVSDMIVSGDFILLGSPFNNYIGRVSRPNAPHQIHVKSVRYEEAKSAEKKETKETAKAASKRTAEEVTHSERLKQEAEVAAKQAADNARLSALEAQRRAAEEEKAKKVAEAAAQKDAEEAKAKRAAEAAAQKAAEEARAKRASEIAAQKAAEARAKRAAEAAAQKAAEQVKAKKVAEEGARKAAEEAKARKQAEEKAHKLAEEERTKKLAEEAKAKKYGEGKSRKAKEGGQS